VGGQVPSLGGMFMAAKRNLQLCFKHSRFCKSAFNAIKQYVEKMKLQISQSIKAALQMPLSADKTTIQCQTNDKTFGICVFRN
jgi:hypothetical protein